MSHASFYLGEGDFDFDYTLIFRLLELFIQAGISQYMEFIAMDNLYLVDKTRNEIQRFIKVPYTKSEVFKVYRIFLDNFPRGHFLLKKKEF